MTATRLDSQSLQSSEQQTAKQLQIATLVMLLIVGLSGLVVGLWFAGIGKIERIFDQIQRLQDTPPLWLEVPMMMGHYLIAPTVILFIAVLVITKISPQPRTWSRVIVVSILLATTIRYVLWRSLSTLNVDDPLNRTFSLLLFLLELMLIASSTLLLVLMLQVKHRQREADALSQHVMDGSFQPTVDIFIPTYDEPAFILKRTIIGCQAIDYAQKTIYLLDDTRRPEMAELAAELGCKYMTRSDNQHAKAGNINHALTHTTGEFIVIFDADFIPTRNFLIRTLGFFTDGAVGLVQTPQSFYNSDPIARNLGLENILTAEEEVFYRQIQPIRDAAGSVTCAGTSFVVRRKALEEIGGFVTDSICEDYFTGIRISANGYRLVYLDEKLSAGLAAENIAAHALQRLRWGRGTLQAFFIPANPLTIPGLTFKQRMAHLEGILAWFTSVARVVFLFMPLAYSFLGVIPLRATTDELLYYFLPYYLVQLTAFAWLNYRSRSAFLSDVYSIVLTLPLALTVVQVMISPFSKGFKVTPKGVKSDRFYFNWGLAWPLMIIFGVTAVSLWRNLALCMIKGDWATSVSPEQALQIKGIGLGWMWSAYNLLILALALLALVDVPKFDLHDWFNLRRSVRIQVESTEDSTVEQAAIEVYGTTTKLSEVGAEIALTQFKLPKLVMGETLPITLEILEEKIAITGKIVDWQHGEEFPIVRVAFEPMTLAQQRQLVVALFCRPGQWKRKDAPGIVGSLFLMVKVLFRPRMLFDRQPQIRAMAVGQG
jgi:cellulose synthase (UDP-forming)